jgi:hypothetical protein
MDISIAFQTGRARSNLSNSRSYTQVCSNRERLRDKVKYKAKIIEYSLREV